jgi:hypothetical protein
MIDSNQPRTGAPDYESKAATGTAESSRQYRRFTLTFRTSTARALLRQAAEKSGHVSFEQSIEVTSFGVDATTGPAGCSPATAGLWSQTAKRLEAIANAEMVFMGLPQRLNGAWHFSFLNWPTQM